MQNTAEVLKFPEARTRALDMPRVRAVDLSIDVIGDGRAIAVAKMRELADRLESGELGGASFEWRHGDALEDATGESVIRSRMVHVTVSTDTDTNIGTVQLTETKIVEG